MARMSGEELGALLIATANYAYLQAVARGEIDPGPPSAIAEEITRELGYVFPESRWYWQERPNRMVSFAVTNGIIGGRYEVTIEALHYEKRMTIERLARWWRDAWKDAPPNRRACHPGGDHE